MQSRLITRRLATVAVAGAATLAVLAPAASAGDVGPHQGTRTVASQAAAKLPAKLTVNSYTTYLKTQKTPEAKKALKGFLALSPAKKAKFVSYLQNRKIYEAFRTQSKGTVGQTFKRVRPYNADVKFGVAINSKKDVAKGTASLSFSVTETIYGIPVTSETVNLSYTLAKGKVVAGSARGTASVKNVNAAISIKGSKVAATTKGVARASTTWKVTPRVASFGKGVNTLQEGWANSGVWAVKLANH